MLGGQRQEGSALTVRLTPWLSDRARRISEKLEENTSRLRPQRPRPWPQRAAAPGSKCAMVYTLSGEAHEIMFEPGEQVSFFKLRVEGIVGTKAVQQRLMCDNEELHGAMGDEHSVEDNEEARINLIVVTQEEGRRLRRREAAAATTAARRHGGGGTAAVVASGA